MLKMPGACFPILRNPDTVFSVFLTANVEIGNWKNSNLAASRSSNDISCSYILKKLKTKIEIKYSKNFF